MTEPFDPAISLALTGSAANGWRAPQRGALGAIIGHWERTTRSPTLVSLPTGTGKSAVAMAAPYLMNARPRRVLVMVPNRALREQSAAQFTSMEVLRRLGVLSPEPPGPKVLEMVGRGFTWDEVEEFDVVVALPNSISPQYHDEKPPPQDLFDLVVVDEAHHTPAATWNAVLEHFHWRRALLLTATPQRRDGRDLPGSLEFHYPLRRALAEGLYHPIEPLILPVPVDVDRALADNSICRSVADLLNEAQHANSTLLVRASTVQRVEELAALYGEHDVEVAVLHGRLKAGEQQAVIDGLRRGDVRGVAVADMLGEGFDLPSLRILAYHDKHRSLPATVQILGRLARVSAEHPQRSRLVTVADQDVFPSLKSAVRVLYDEDRDWSEILPSLIDDHIETEQDRREFVAALPSDAATPVALNHLQPTTRSIVYEVPSDWECPFAGGQVPDDLGIGSAVLRGEVVYAGAYPRRSLLILVTVHADQPAWSTDPMMATRRYELHVLAHLPREDGGLVFVNSTTDATARTLVGRVGLRPGELQLLDPERLNTWLDGLTRSSVHGVGLRRTDGNTDVAYLNHMGSAADVGLRRVDKNGVALGHVMLSFRDHGDVTRSGGAALEKGKIWAQAQAPLLDYLDWIQWLEDGLAGGATETTSALLPDVDRGRRCVRWPAATALLAQVGHGVLGHGFRIVINQGNIPIEEMLLEVEAEHTDDFLTMRAIVADGDDQDIVWEGTLTPTGLVARTSAREVTVRLGMTETCLMELLADAGAPRILFADGTSVVAGVAYHRSSTRLYNPRDVLAGDWTDETNIKVETRGTITRNNLTGRCVHEDVETWLVARERWGRHRWVFLNDGKGEIADHVVVEENDMGRVRVGLWHSKASTSEDPGTRIGDLQVVVAQAVRSRRHLTSAIWERMRARLDGEESPLLTPVDGTDDIDLLRDRLLGPDGWLETGLAPDGEIGVVQPGLSRQELMDAAARNDVDDVLYLLTEVADAAEEAQGAFVCLGSA